MPSMEASWLHERSTQEQLERSWMDGSETCRSIEISTILLVKSYSLLHIAKGIHRSSLET